MLRIRAAQCLVALAALIIGGCGAALAQSIGLAVIDFPYVDTSGEPIDQTAAHQRRLDKLMTALRRDLVADGRFQLVLVPCGSANCTNAGQTPADLLRAASEAGAKLLVIGGVHKLSTLLQWMKVDVIDVGANRVVLDRRYSFRGDSDEAWTRAQAFVSREIRAALAVR
jgi:hypothetical protein